MTFKELKQLIKTMPSNNDSCKVLFIHETTGWIDSSYDLEFTEASIHIENIYIDSKSLPDNRTETITERTVVIKLK